MIKYVVFWIVCSIVPVVHPAPVDPYNPNYPAPDYIAEYSFEVHRDTLFKFFNKEDTAEDFLNGATAGYIEKAWMGSMYIPILGNDNFYYSGDLWKETNSVDTLNIGGKSFFIKE